MSNNNAPDVRARLDAIRARWAAITPGPWTQGEQYADGVIGIRSSYDNVAEVIGKADAAFIAAAPSDYDEMLAIIDTLLAERPAPTAAGAAEPYPLTADHVIVLSGCDKGIWLTADPYYRHVKELDEWGYIYCHIQTIDGKNYLKTWLTPAGQRVLGNAATEHVTVERAHVEGRYPYRWQEEGGKWHTVTNIVNDGKTDEYEIWFEAVDPDAWAVVRRTEKLLRGGAL